MLTKPAADTYLRVGPFTTQAEVERLRYMLAEATPVPSRLQEAAMIRHIACVSVPTTTATPRRPWRESSAAGFEPEASQERCRGQGGQSVDMRRAET